MAFDIKEFMKVDNLIKLPTSKKLLLLGAVNAVLVGLTVYLLILPKNVEIGVLKGGLADMEFQLKLARDKAQNIPKAKQENEELNARLKLAQEQLPKEDELDDLLSSVDFAARDSGLVVNSFIRGQDVPKGFYAEVHVDMEVYGTYESLFDFCKKVSQLSRIVNLTGLNIKVDPLTSMTFAPKLLAKFDVIAFKFLSDTQTEQKKLGAKK